MRKPYVIAVLLICAATACFFVFVGHEPEPTVDGRTLSEWLRYGLDGPDGRLRNQQFPNLENWKVDVTNAVRKIGPDAVPALVTKLSTPDSSLKQSLRNSTLKKWLPYGQLHSAELERAEAQYGFGILGTQALAALPQLSNTLFAGRDVESVGEALGLIGPPSLPILKSALTNRDFVVRCGAVIGLTARGDVIRGAIPELISLRHDTNTFVPYLALSQIQLRGLEAEFLPVAVEYIQDARSEIQVEAADAIARVATNRTLLTPVLLPLLTNADRIVRAQAQDILDRVDSATAQTNRVDAPLGSKP